MKTLFWLIFSLVLLIMLWPLILGTIAVLLVWAIGVGLAYWFYFREKKSDDSADDDPADLA